MKEDEKAIVPRGTAIITAKPFAYALNSNCRESRCDSCLKSGKLLKCSSCHYVFYCDRNCQREAWSIHKLECEKLRKVSPKVLPDAARLMARIIMKLKKGGTEERGWYTEAAFRQFKDLMSHYSNIKKDQKRMDHFASLCAVLMQFFGETVLPNSAELMGIYGRICVNSFNILDPEMNSIGVGIYLAPSIIDHSCQPNAVAVFEGTKIMIRITEDLPRLDFSLVRISYTDILSPTEDRRKELQQSYYFVCDCSRCTNPQKFITAAACPNDRCEHPCLINKEKACAKCRTQITDKYKEKFQEVTEFTVNQLNNMKSMAYLDVCKTCLNMQKDVLHLFNVYHVKTLESAYEAAANLNSWVEAESFALKLIPGYLKYYGDLHPMTGLSYLWLGKIQLYLNKDNVALESLKKAESILSMTHGVRHSIIRDSLRPLLFQASVNSNGS